MKDLIVIILSYLSQYLESLIGLLSGPKTFARTLFGNNDKSLTESFIFLGISFVLHSLLYFQIYPKDVDFLQYMAAHAILLFILTFINLGLLKISWQIVRGQGPFTKHLTILLYYSGAEILIFSACHLLKLGTIKVLYPDYFKVSINLIRSLDHKEMLEYVNKMVEAGKFSEIGILMCITSLPFIATLFWNYIGWGAFRELNHTSKHASATALIMYLAFSAISQLPIYFITQAAMSIAIKQ